MGKKKGGKVAGGAKPQKNFQQLVAEAATQTVKPFIQQQMQMLGHQLQQEQQSTMRALYVRATTLESIIQEKFEISDSQLAELVADTEDKGSGLLKVEGEAEEGDTLRITVSTKAKDQEEFQGTSKLLIDNLGKEPFTIGPELEPHLVGMLKGDVKEVPFGKDESLIAKLEVNRVSRRPVVEKPGIAEAPKEVEKTKGVVDANAGQ